MRLPYILILLLVFFSSSLFALKEDEMAISKDGRTIFYVHRILNNGMVQVLQRFPLIKDARSQQVSQQDVFGEVDSYQEATRYDVFIDAKNEFYSAVCFFSNGYARFSSWKKSAEEKIIHLSELTRASTTYKVVRDETGSLLYIVAELDDNRVIVNRGHHNSAFIRSPKGLLDASVVETQEAQIIRKLAEQVFGGVFEEIRQGRTLDLKDPVQFDVFAMYASLQLTAGDKVDWGGSRKTLREVQDFIEKHRIHPKESLDVVQVTTASGRRLQLRRLSLEEAPFRGCIGRDCSTATRLLRALEPAHFHFIIEEIPFRALGQIELVRGMVEGDQKEYAFFERIQSPVNLRADELGALLTGLLQALAKKDIHFAMAKDLQVYSKLGHAITNYGALGKRLKDALELYFIQSAKSLQFRRHPDQYIEGREREYPANLVAHRMEKASEPIYEITPVAANLEGKATIQLNAPKLSFDPLSPTLFKQAKAIVELEKNKAELSEIALRSVCENLLDQPR